MSWVFGYGSLIWRPAFPHTKRRPARIEGWARRFWQGSTDHRGVPEAPGRVVTLVPKAGAICQGVAYLPRASIREAILDQLDCREKGGYRREQVMLYFEDRDPVKGLVYIAAQDNKNYLGKAELSAISRQIAHAKGPSGRNIDYLFQLADALRELGATDSHVFAVEKEVSRLASGD